MGVRAIRRSLGVGLYSGAMPHPSTTRWQEFHCVSCDAKWFTASSAFRRLIVNCPHCGAPGTRIGSSVTTPSPDLQNLEQRQRADRQIQRQVTPLVRSCPFCGVKLVRKRNQSREHVLARWVRELSMFQDAVRSSSGGGRGWTLDSLSIRDGAIQIPAPRQLENVHSHTLAVTVYVCDSCNNGWMSQLERQAIPHLRPLIEGTSTSVPRGARAQLARWVGKTMVAFEQDDPPTAAALPEQVHDIRFGRPPRYTRLWIAPWKEPQAPLMRHSLAQAIAPPFRIVWEGSKMLIAVGHVVFYMLSSSSPATPPGLEPGEPWSLLWPDSKDDVHLKASGVDRAGLDAIDGGGPAVMSPRGEGSP